MPLTVRDLMTPAVTVPADDAPRRAGSPTVVVDRAGGPEWLIGPDGPTAAVLVPSSTTVTELLDDPMLLDLLADGLPGVVIGGATGVLGFVTATSLLDAMEASRSDEDAVTGTLGEPIDVETPGAPRPVGVIVIRCRRCGRRNELSEYPEPGQECVSGGHPLEPTWS